jgi:hypothetical protein
MTSRCRCRCATWCATISRRRAMGGTLPSRPAWVLGEVIAPGEIHRHGRGRVVRPRPGALLPSHWWQSAVSGTVTMSIELLTGVVPPEPTAEGMGYAAANEAIEEDLNPIAWLDGAAAAVEAMDCLADGTDWLKGARRRVAEALARRAS